jgi:16S rRNA (cytidine1402-2'-O)-methyltransferase
LAGVLTMIHEETVRGTLPELAERFRGGARGEVTLVIEGASAAQPTAADAASTEAHVRERARQLLDAGHSPREVADQLRAETGAPRRALYALALEVRGRA